ncbi:hypothetical protein [Massilia varians]|uniref:hypothetical protein n=1 Tax=Massilia varians TaxID=457921 RepID=UPI002557A193|nr:hypothetical protein [Massilia varians]MDK6079685.1 hypothetical protein [Massilia varians]
MTLSQRTIGTIARALLNDQQALSKDFAFWSTPERLVRYPEAGAAVSDLLHESTFALIELADTVAPWLKQRPDWEAITNNTPQSQTKETA